MNNSIIFSLPGNKKFAHLLVKRLHIAEGGLVIKKFPDGESYVRIDSMVKNKIVILFCTFVKTSGSRGVHVLIKVDGSFKDVKDLAKKIAEKLNKKCPRLTTLEQRKKKREDKVFIDFLRNDYSMTTIASYSLHALQGAPIATLIS